MARTGRPGLSHEQKAELWRRWKAGETLSDIGRALGKHAASVFGVVAAKGGFAPLVWSRRAGSLSMMEREEISRGLVSGRSFRQLGRDLGRAVSTIRREVARNGGRRAYRAARADERALDRARRPKPCQLAFSPALCKLVAGKLAGQWSPQKIAGWLKARYPGDLRRVGIECTGSYGAGLLRFLQQAGIEVLDVTTPDKLERRRKGKNDDLDAENAAHAAFAGVRTVTPRSRDGMVEALRVLKVCRKSAIAARRVALQMIQGTIVSAPDAPRDRLRETTRMQLIRTLAASRPDMSSYRDVEGASRIALRSLARRYVELHDEIGELDERIGAIVEDLAPELVTRCGIGRETAAQLPLTAGDNPGRLTSEASFAALCGVSPVPASSGKTIRHRLNRGGDRAANSALHIIAVSRMRLDLRTKDYVAKRTAMGHSKREAIRMLKRYIAREVFGIIRAGENEISRPPAAAP